MRTNLKNSNLKMASSSNPQTSHFPGVNARVSMGGKRRSSNRLRKQIILENTAAKAVRYYL